jgi:transcriptional regulator with XRE-family HTH domain
MFIGERLKQLREHKRLSQGDVEKRTGLLRCHISRVENGHAVPAMETLEKMAHALEIPLYQLFYEGTEKSPASKVTKSDRGWGSRGSDAKTLDRFRRLLRRTSTQDQKLLLFMAQKMARRWRGDGAETFADEELVGYGEHDSRLAGD